MDQLIEMGIFDEILIEQDELEEGVLKRHGKDIKLSAAGGGAAGMAIGGALGDPIGAGIGGALGLGAGALLSHRIASNKDYYNLIKQNRKIDKNNIKDINTLKDKLSIKKQRLSNTFKGYSSAKKNIQNIRNGSPIRYYDDSPYEAKLLY